MLTALQTRKLTRAFSLFDVDQNGFMEAADCELVVSATTQAMGYALGSPEYTAYYTEYMAGWNALVQLGDSDNDQRLTVAEYCAAYDKMMAQPAQFNAVILGVVKTIITLWDSNKDGKVSKAEYQAYMVAFHVTETEAAEAFRRLDRNGDGYLTTDELIQNAKEFFLSSDPQAAGNWLVGPF
jgi:Ca2+-binding EF-hand superfamily protein